MKAGFLDRLRTATGTLPQAARLWGSETPPAPPPGTETEIGRLFRTDPYPLIHPQARMVVLFSAKSACSSVVIWFLKQLGHLEAARDFHRWPHEYRVNVYYRSQLYTKAFRRNLANYRIVRVVRDPFSRAISSYRHALAFGYANQAMAKFLRRRDIAESGYSFAEFLDYLERIDLTACDIHHRVQRHPLEDRLPVRHLINVSTEDLFTRLNEVEADLRLPHTDFAAIPWFGEVNDPRAARGGLDDLADVENRRFTSMAARKGPWAPYDAFLTPTTRARIGRLYAVDVAAYGGGGGAKKPDRVVAAAAEPALPR